MSNKWSQALVLIFLSALGSCFPVSEGDTHASRHTPYRHPLPTTQTIHSNAHSQTPSSKVQQLQPAHENNIHSMFSGIRRSLYRIFASHHDSHAQKSYPYPRREDPADDNWDSDEPDEEESKNQEFDTPEAPSNPKKNMPNKLGVAGDRHMPRDELVQMVRLWSKMFQAIEMALTEDVKPDIPRSRIAEKETKKRGGPSSDEPGTPTTEREQKASENWPDVRLALAEAAKLNGRRELIRQQKFADLDDEQSDDVDYTQGLPRSAPSFATRVRMQKAAKAHR